MAIIGDVVGSRGHTDREALHHALAQALTETTGSRTWQRVPRVTVGDEFQAGVASVDAALAAVWDLRVALLPGVDVRYGIGLGQAQVLDEESQVEDGTAWWAARAAIDQAKADGRTGPRRVRIRLHESIDDPLLGGAVRAADAAQGAVDADFAALDDVDVALLRALRAGASQTVAGKLVGITQPSVSHRVRARGIGRLLALRADLG